MTLALSLPHMPPFCGFFDARERRTLPLQMSTHASIVRRPGLPRSDVALVISSK